MRTLTLFFSALFVYAASAQDVQVFTLDKDIEKAGFYYYRTFGKALEKELLAGEIAVYEDAAGKQKVTTKSFNEENNMYRMVQLINPLTPDDPYNLVDTQMYYKHPVSEANYIQWHESMFEFRANTLKGLKSYFVPLSKLDDLKEHEGYALLELLSKKHGQVSPTVIQNNSHALLMDFCEKLYDPKGLDSYKDASLETKMTEAELYDTLVYDITGNKTQEVYYYPKSEASMTGLVMSYASEMDEDEFELEIHSFAPTYDLVNYNKNKPWYWVDAEDATERFTETEWKALMSIQYYSFKRKIFSQFEYKEAQ